MSNITSTLDIILKDDVTPGAQKVAAALKRMETEAKAVDQVLARSGAGDKLQASMKRMGAEVHHVEAMSKAWQDYAKSQGLAADRSSWTKGEAAGVRNWEAVTTARVRAVMSIERALEEQRSRQSAQHRQQLEAEARAAHRAAEQQAHMQSRMGAGHAVLTAAAMAVSAHSIMHVIGESMDKGAELQHERIGLQNAGRTPAEMAEIEAATRATVRDLPTAGYTESMKVIAETTSAFGSLHHAIENLPFMMQTMSSLKAAAGDKIEGDAGTVGRYFAKFFEERMTRPEDFQKEAKQMIPAMVASGGVFNPQEMFAFAQQAKSSLPNYDMQFLSRVIPSLVTTMGGNRAGTAANAFTSVITGKVNDKKQAEAFQKLGLLDMSKVIMKSGHAVGWSAGAVKDTAMALTNPLKWAETYLVPALKNAGIDTSNRLAVTTALATMFRNQNANMFANEITQEASRNRLHKDEGLYNQVGSADEIYQRNLEDLKVAAGAFTGALGDLAAAVTAQLIGPTAKGLSMLASAIHQISDAAMAHPNIAAGAGVVGAGAALGGAGWLGYQVMNGFGLGTAATALEGSAAAIDAAAGRLGLGGVAAGAGGAAAGEAAVAEMGLAAALSGFTVAAAPLTAALAAVAAVAKWQKDRDDAEARNLKHMRDDLPNLDDQTSRQFWRGVLPKSRDEMALGYRPADEDRATRADRNYQRPPNANVPIPVARPSFEQFGPERPTPLLPPIGWGMDPHPQPAFPHTRTDEAPVGDGLRDPNGPVLGGGTMRTGQLDELKDKAAQTKTQLDALNDPVTLAIGTSAIDAAIAKLATLKGELASLGSAGGAGSAGSGSPGGNSRRSFAPVSAGRLDA